MSLREDLLSGRKKIGIWGTGYIGFSSMANFAAKGVQVQGYDIDPEIVKKVNAGEIPVENLEYWLGFDIRELRDAELIHATSKWEEMISPEIAVHLVAIPTEKAGKPWDGPLKDVISKLASYKGVAQPLVIIESTLTPGRTDKIIVPILEEAGLKVGEDILVGVAPRRDWFISPDKSLKTLPRIIGGTNQETTNFMREALGIVCDNLLDAPDHRHAEMIKSVENAYRHMDITLANQLSRAFPHLDMHEVLRLVGTKWNIGTYHPSFGTGGYCIPLSSQYVLLGAEKPDELTLLKETVKTDSEQPLIVADAIADRGAKRVGILGLSYKGDLKVHILSPAKKIVERLKKKGVDVKLHDPYFSEEEIRNIVDVETFTFPEGLDQFDTILIVADHRRYTSLPYQKILDQLKKCDLVVDNTGIWRNIPLKCEYHEAGDAGWLEK